MLGEKGIGRFAAARLANSLEVVTRHAGTDREIRAFFDWKQFDDEQKYLDQVEVAWEQRDPEETRSEGTFQLLGEAGNLTHGTILRMKELRTTWGKQQAEELHTGLSPADFTYCRSRRVESGRCVRGSFAIPTSI